MYPDARNYVTAVGRLSQFLRLMPGLPRLNSLDIYGIPSPRKKDTESGTFIPDSEAAAEIPNSKPGLRGLAGPGNFQARALGPMKPGVGPGSARACGARLGGLQGFRPGHAKHYSLECLTLSGKIVARRINFHEENS
ncbi:hypothetical protein B0H14DRAFT_2589879 [Mycena olivaceomarginata]|nr:hypothetical protein B0H14DRAFT_2589879 [Mycena olivaceomarginata]